MPVTLSEILTLVGQLDDAPGFDTPRERFRRFLFERLENTAALRALIEEGQYAAGEQSRRAVQDALVVLGRSLGFETVFGTYEGVAGTLKFDGLWRSRQSVELTLDLRTGPADRNADDLERLVRSLAALPSPAGTDVRHMALCIVTPSYGNRARLDEAIAAQNRQADIRVASIKSVLWLAEAAGAGGLRHEEVVRLLTTEHTDFIVELLARTNTTASAPVAPPIPSTELEEGAAVSSVAAGPALVPSPSLAAPARVPAAPPSHWLATIEPDDGTTPEQMVQNVIGRRRLLGVRNGAATDRPHAGDWVCFSIRGKGIAGHGQVDALADAPPQLRDAHRFGAVFILKNVDIYDTPVALAPDARVHEVSDETHTDNGGSSLTVLSEEEFAALTAHVADGWSAMRSAS